ncbi:MAG: DUF1080 domain-containing protein [Verrucomicrobiales bacterium]|jgi:hypothetical protein|nr:DUF1080 domain-containing protein [Verrucomicrobiales bacterium]
MKHAFSILSGAAFLAMAPSLLAQDAFLGRWALTIPNGGAGWLGVEKKDGYYDAGILWGGGSVVPVASVYFPSEDTMVVTRVNDVKRRDASGKKVVRTHQFTDLVKAKVNGDVLSLTISRPKRDGSGVTEESFSGKRIAPLPLKPDLAKVKFADSQVLFRSESDLTKWELMNPDKKDNGWSVKDGVLMNRAAQEEGKPRKHYGNLQTKEKFEDFNLTLDVRVPKNGNSGLYLRGIYEIQVADTHDKPLDSHHMGGIYSRVAPSVMAEKPTGEWQTYDITLVDRHVTVILNGKKIHDNVPLEGCTGGALWSDETLPGPLYLQGDHTDVDYRNVVIRPVAK